MKKGTKKLTGKIDTSPNINQIVKYKSTYKLWCNLIPEELNYFEYNF